MRVQWGAPMMRICLLVTILLVAPAASADAGTAWFDALIRGKAKVAAKHTVTTGLKYGDTGKDSVISKKIGAHYSKIFRSLKKRFMKLSQETGNCTSVGRELGYMANEWRTKNSDTADWIQRIPEQFCESNDLNPPRMWLVKDLEGDTLPHALILIATGEDDLITGVYHF